MVFNAIQPEPAPKISMENLDMPLSTQFGATVIEADEKANIQSIEMPGVPVKLIIEPPPEPPENVMGDISVPPAGFNYQMQ